MCVKVPRSSIELSFGHDALQVFYLQIESEGKVGYFFSHRRRGGALTMSAAQHRSVREFICQVGKLGLQVFEGGKDDILKGVVEHQRVRQIVDIFARAREVKILLLAG